MPGNKKPSKKYRPRPVINPLNARSAWVTEGDVLVAMLAVENGVAEEAHWADIAAHADIVRRLPVAEHVGRQANGIIRLLSEISVREWRAQRMEIVGIQAALEVTLPAMRAARNADIYRAAEASRRDLNQKGVRVWMN